MKELTIEEKAKSYDEAIKRAREIVNNKDASSIWKDWLKNTFTELKEDKDEKIRKYILKCCEETIEANDRGLELSMDTTKKLKNWLEKQGSQQPTIIWHSVSEEPEEMKELFCEWESDDATWHDVAFYDEESKTFRHAKMPINVTKWVYVDELLERQGEQKPVLDFKASNWYVSKVDGKIHDMTYSSANKVESKFKVGDWIIFYGGNPFKILKVEQEQNGILNYLLLDQNERDSYYNKKYVDENARLWTIQDAKDGDILTGKIDGDTYILIYKQTTDRWIETYGHYYNTVNRFCVPSQLFCRDYQGTFTPASKEQRNLLFAKMKEAGYNWDSEKKELIRLSRGLLNGVNKMKQD